MLGIPEEAFSELHWYELVKLWFRAHQDVRKKRFGQGVFQSPDGTEQVEVVTSPFVAMEVRRYCGKRDQYLGGRLHLFCNINSSLKMRPRMARFSKMLRAYDEKISWLETDINIDIMRTDDMLDRLQRQRDIHESRDEPHMVQLCINKADKLRGEYYDRNIAKYQSLQCLLNRKIGKLETAQKHLETVRRRILVRLAYYYYRASNKDRSLAHFDMSEAQLAAISDLRVMEQYQRTMLAAVRKLEQIEKDIALLSSWRSR